MEKLIRQWPGFIGFFLIGLGLYIVLTAHAFNIRAIAILFGGGVAALAYWTFANSNDKYNF